MSCKYKVECPSYSGWCDGPRQDFERCISFLITALENERKKNTILYLCDHRACDPCGGGGSECRHTTDIRHAKNFKNECGVFREVYPPSEKNEN